jgi:predicted house-cleaning noncanonical NTP pyrophosphatase (MazG superfamily)
VNAGPIAICKTFLGNPSQYPPELIAKLQKSMKHFVEVCARAVEENKTLIKEDMLEFQYQLLQAYQKLNEQVTHYTGGKKEEDKLADLLPPLRRETSEDGKSTLDRTRARTLTKN